MTGQLTMDRQVAGHLIMAGRSWRAVLAAAAVATVLLLLLLPLPVRAATFAVINTDDSGAGSLRAAITAANSTPNIGGPDLITFAIPGSGVKTILVLTALPAITDPVIINGYTQPGATPNTLAVGNDANLLIVLDGSSTPNSTTGLRIDSGDTIVRGLSIFGFGGVTDVGIFITYVNDIGIRIVAGTDNTGNVIAGNFIGIQPDGTRPAELNTTGLSVGSDDNLIGGTSPADRNVIAPAYSQSVILDGTTDDPVTGNHLEGNYLGTNAQGDGTFPVPEILPFWSTVMLMDADENVIGGSAPGAGNVIAARLNGIELGQKTSLRQGPSSGNLIQGNHIGINAAGVAVIDAAGVALIGTSRDGITVNFGTNNTIGGTVAGAGNVISGNREFGIDMDTTGNVVQGNLVGTNAAGTAAVPNGWGVMVLEADNLIGGLTAAARNVISGNLHTGLALGGNASDVLVQGNYIGTIADGDSPLGNGGIGVTVLQVSGNTIGGTSPGARNVISGNGLDGVSTNTGSNLVQGNYVGLNAAGDAAIPNQRHGVVVGSGTTGTVIGGTTAAARNVISGNAAEGVRMFGDGAAVEGNFIGTDAAGTDALGNGEEGVYISFGGSGNRVGGSAAGQGNLIAFNDGAGVAIEFIDGFDPVTGNVVARNSIHSNGGLGIDLGNDGPTANDHCDADDGANGLRNAPEIYSVTPGAGGTTDVHVRLDSAPNQTYQVEFFVTPIESPTAFLESKTFVGTADLAVGASCVFDGVVNLPGTVPSGHWVTGTVDGLSELVPPPAVTIDDVSQLETDAGTTDFSFTVSMSAPWHSTITIDYDTADDTASAPSDYTAATGTLSFLQGQTTRTITVSVNGDTDIESDEHFFVDLSAFSLGADWIEDARGRGAVLNDDDDDPPTDPTYFSILLDRSASMRKHRAETIRNYNLWLADQQETLLDARGTMALFTSCAYRQRGASGRLITDLPTLTKATYKPACRTPLYDAIAKTINRAARHPLSDGSVVIVIYTDGLDNASKRWTQATLDALIEDKVAAGWTFVWLGDSPDPLIQEWRGS